MGGTDLDFGMEDGVAEEGPPLIRTHVPRPDSEPNESRPREQAKVPDAPAPGPSPVQPAAAAPAKVSLRAPFPSLAGDDLDLLVKDLLRKKRIPERPAPGLRTLMRVGGRAWTRPNVCISGRLYKRFAVEDPWDPEGGKTSGDLGIGSVAFKLGEGRREVAPHAKIKEPKPNKPAAAVAEDPVARFRKAADNAAAQSKPPETKPAESKPPEIKAPEKRPGPAGEAQASPPPRPAESKAPWVPRPAEASDASKVAPNKAPPATPSPNKTAPSAPSALAAEFGGRAEKQGLVGKLPVRPDLQPGATPNRPVVANSKIAPAAGPPVSTPAAPAPGSGGAGGASKSTFQARRAIDAGGPARPALMGKLPTRPDLADKAQTGPQAPGPATGTPVERPSVTSLGPALPRRVRATPTASSRPVSTEPEVIELADLPPPTPVVATQQAVTPAPSRLDLLADPPEAALPKAAPPKAPVERRPPGGPVGLDDLFGLGGGDNTRMSMRRAKKEGDAEKPPPKPRPMPAKPPEDDKA